MSSSRFAAFGVVVEIAFAEAALRDAFAPFLPVGHEAAEGAPVARFRIASAADIGPVDALVRQAIAEHAPEHVFVHAGVVACRGRALVLPADSRAGKSELVTALLRAGAEYCSDEFAVLDDEGRVLPYPRPVSLRRPEPRDVAAEELGARVATAPLPVGAVVFTRYEPGASWAPESLTPAAALLRLLEHAGQVRAAPDRVLSALQRAVDGVVLAEGPRGEAAEAAPALLELL